MAGHNKHPAKHANMNCHSQEIEIKPTSSLREKMTPEEAETGRGDNHTHSGECPDTALPKTEDRSDHGGDDSGNCSEKESGDHQQDGPCVKKESWAQFPPVQHQDDAEQTDDGSQQGIPVELSSRSERQDEIEYAHREEQGSVVDHAESGGVHESAQSVLPRTITSIWTDRVKSDGSRQ